MMNIQKNNDIHIQRSLSSLNDGKYDRTTDARMGTFYDHGKSHKMNIRIHFPTNGNNIRQQSIIIANSIGENDKNRIAIRRRNSDSKLDSYIKFEGIEMNMNINDIRRKNLDETKVAIHQTTREEFSIAVKVESIIAFPGTEDPHISNGKCKKLSLIHI